MISSLSVVIPAFNEEKRIVPTIRRIREYLEENVNEFEIVVVDDGSTDKTSEFVRVEMDSAEGLELLRNGVNRGKGFSVRRGVMASRYELVLISDADLSTPIEEVERLLPWLESGYDVVIGSRALRESEILLQQPWHRRNMGRMFNVLVKMLLMRGMKDTQCGFKVFRAEAAKEVFGASRVDRFAFDVEALFLARKMGFRIKEAPVRWINSPKSRVRIALDSLNMFADLFRIRLIHWRAPR